MAKQIKGWEVDGFGDADKEIRIYASSGINVVIDYDGVDQREARKIAEFIAEKSCEYREWKLAKKK